MQSVQFFICFVVTYFAIICETLKTHLRTLYSAGRNLSAGRANIHLEHVGASSMQTDGHVSSCLHCFGAEASGCKMCTHSELQLSNQNSFIRIKNEYNKVASWT